MDKSMSDAKSVLLDPNHSHYIFIDDEAKGEFGHDVRFRTNLEAEMRKSKSSNHAWPRRKSSVGSFINSLDGETDDEKNSLLDQELTELSIPMILICVNGGLDALKQICEVLKQRTPILILQVYSSLVYRPFYSKVKRFTI
jgi:hypothetical protein